MCSIVYLPGLITHMNHDMTHILNQQMACPRCRMHAGWRMSSRRQRRQNSLIYRFRCQGCDEKVIVKLPRLPSGSSTGQRQHDMDREYRILHELQARFPQDAGFGTLVPLGRLDVHGAVALVTRAVVGENLLQRARRMGVNRFAETFGGAGILLRKLHDCSPRTDASQPLDVDKKVTYLLDAYKDVLTGNPALYAGWTHFRQATESIRNTPIHVSWHHGDFTPDNVLFADGQYLVVDTLLEFDCAFVYDLASFLDHVLLAGNALWGSVFCRHYPAIEAAFLAGYGGLNEQELCALRWAQTYFMLHYVCRYRHRAMLVQIYAKWMARHLLRRLDTQL